MVFTGDTLFVGSIGRTDLQGKDAQPKQAEKLFTSLHEKLLPLEDAVLVYPAHGSGSVCGSGIGEQTFSTIGFERQTNPFLRLNKEEFVEKAVSARIDCANVFCEDGRIQLAGRTTIRRGFLNPER